MSFFYVDLPQYRNNDLYDMWQILENGPSQEVEIAFSRKCAIWVNDMEHLNRQFDAKSIHIDKYVNSMSELWKGFQDFKQQLHKMLSLYFRGGEKDIETRMALINIERILTCLDTEPRLALGKFISPRPHFVIQFPLAL